MSENKPANFVIVDTGCANLASVKFAVERLGFSITISDDINTIKSADKVILPGVGSARHAINRFELTTNKVNNSYRPNNNFTAAYPTCTGFLFRYAINGTLFC